MTMMTMMETMMTMTKLGWGWIGTQKDTELINELHSILNANTSAHSEHIDVVHDMQLRQLGAQHGGVHDMAVNISAN